ncbi:MAG: TrkA C-terminal domain-containing protein [Arhodomonas sp.]|nr:TrkA C-terminal domain-containing protein [Arhodomonas sp.]
MWLERFHSAGATAIVPEVLEASLMLATHALTLLGIPLGRIFRYVRDVRANRYRMLRGYFHGQERVDLEKADRFREQLHAVTLPEQAHAVGRRLAELRLDEAGIDVTAVRRGGIRGPQPEPHTRLRSGDVVVLYGTPENLEHAERLLLGGGRWQRQGRRYALGPEYGHYSALTPASSSIQSTAWRISSSEAIFP